MFARQTRQLLNGLCSARLMRIGQRSALVSQAHSDISRIRPFPDFDGFYGPAITLPDMPATCRTQRQLKDVRIGFIGWGSMAQAISLGLLREDATAPEKIMVSGRREEVLDKARKEGMDASTSNRSVAEWADIVVVAVKPQMLDSVMPDIAAAWHKDKLLVSVCAGVSIDTFLQKLGENAKVVRTMPNTPCMIGEAATAYSGSSQCEDWELQLVDDLFSAVGKVHQVPEHLMNAVTGVSGSGPAYIYMLIQALSDAGVHSGLPRDVSLSLATQTVVGAAKMVQTGTHPALLKESVTSPGGTTIAGVKALEMGGFNATVMQAVHAAKTRSEELSQLQTTAQKPRGWTGARRARRGH
eukprot:TRINITY_DN12110_c0_g1_i1.p1 TRINITY_DN12110_c0_g1~~TRINITY_DN12110_c0_g1_i1.p1  ORF type:complete len:380 (-),score=76.51 TRINITY_DN12110_c0_g1_i1:177-1241(-)